MTSVENFISDKKPDVNVQKVLHEILLWTPYDTTDTMYDLLLKIWTIPPGHLSVETDGFGELYLFLDDGNNFWNKIVISQLQKSLFWNMHFVDKYNIDKYSYKFRLDKTNDEVLSS